MIVISSVLEKNETHDLFSMGASDCKSIVSDFPTGVRIPAAGESEHDFTEISLVLSGSFELESGGKQVVLGAGDLVVVPAGERHFLHVKSATKIFTVTIGAAR